MPIQEAYREEAISKVKTLGEALRPKVEELLRNVEPEDIEFGVKLELRAEELKELWKECMEENNYMEVVYTEVMEHHDGAYLKATFRNSAEDYYADRYVSIRSSGKVEKTHAFYIVSENVKVRIEKVDEGVFSLFLKAQ